MEKVEVLQLVGIYDKRISTMGNPSYKVSFRKASGDYLTGRTASNASVGYWLCDSHIGKMVQVTYHYTRKGNCTVDKIKEVK